MAMEMDFKMKTVIPHPKPGPKRKKKRQTDEAYLSFIGRQFCLVCYRNGEAHHEPIGKTSGMGMKGPDRETVPLCRGHHSERHQIGKLTFWKKYNIDYVKEINRLQSLYKKL